MRRVHLLFSFLVVFLLTGCQMMSWESGFESQYTENADGTLTTVDGIILDSRGREIDKNKEMDNESDLDDKSDDSFDNMDDPYRKYDDGVVEYNYDEMQWVIDGSRTYYVKKDTQVLHGMYFSTLDGIVENGIIAITFYYDGEEIRHVEYYDYPLIESDRRYFDTWSNEDYIYYHNAEEVMEYYKSEYIDNAWELVEKKRFNENGTLNYIQQFYPLGRTYQTFDDNGMVINETVINFPSITDYSYFSDGSISSMLEGTVNTNKYTYDDFIEDMYNSPGYHLYVSAIYENYREPGVLEESGEYGEMTMILREYDENGIITLEKEKGYTDYNTVIWMYERFYTDGVFDSETCWDNDGYSYCSD